LRGGGKERGADAPLKLTGIILIKMEREKGVDTHSRHPKDENNKNGSPPTSPKHL
jgi:hypothetical protein